MVVSKTIASLRAGAVAGAAAAASAAAAAGPDDAEDAKPKGIERHEGAAYPNAWPGGPAAAAAGDPLITRTQSTRSPAVAVAAAAGSATVPSRLLGADHLLIAAAAAA